MANLRSMGLALVISTTLAACSASVQVAVAPAEVKDSAQSAVRYTDAAPEVKTINDLTVYKIEQDVDINVWIVYYFSPSRNKSYRCRVKPGEKANLEEVADEAKKAKPGQRIDRDKWKVDSQAAKQTVITNVTNITNVTVNVTQINTTTLISPDEFKQATGKDSADPVWVCVVNNIKVYVNANTNVVVHTDGAPAPSPSPSPMPSASPTPMPSVAPSATPAATITFNATLNGAAEVPPVTTAATGTATGTLSADKLSFTLTASWTGLSGPATGAHIHTGAVGTSGAVVKALVVTGDTATVTWASTDATEPLTTAFADALVAGTLYVNVHTAANPNGEIRGQLLMP